MLAVYLLSCGFILGLRRHLPPGPGILETVSVKVPLGDSWTQEIPGARPAPSSWFSPHRSRRDSGREPFPHLDSIFEACKTLQAWFGI